MIYIYIYIYIYVHIHIHIHIHTYIHTYTHTHTPRTLRNPNVFMTINLVFSVLLVQCDDNIVAL